TSSSYLCYFSCLLFLLCSSLPSVVFFFFTDTATTDIYTLSLHDALPISLLREGRCFPEERDGGGARAGEILQADVVHAFRLEYRSEEHTSELQSRVDLVCRLLLEKKKKKH